MAYNPNNPNVTPAANLANTDGQPVVSENMIFDGTTWDRNRSIDAFVTPSATPTTGLQAAIAPDRRYTAVSLATAANSNQTWDTNGADSVLIYVGTSTTGTMIIEVSGDGSNWTSAEVRDSQTNLWVSGLSLTPTAAKTYRVITVGYRSMRVRTVTTLGATVSLTITLAADSDLVAAIKTGPSPHDFGYTPVHKDVEYTTAQTGTTIWTPTSGKKFVVTDVTIATGGTTAGVVTLFDNTDAANGRIVKAAFAPSASSSPGLVKQFRTPYISAAANNLLKITTSAAMTVYVQIDGYEI